MCCVLARVRGEVRAGALSSEDRAPAGGPLVDPPFTWSALRGVGTSTSVFTLSTLLSLSLRNGDATQSSLMSFLVSRAFHRPSIRPLRPVLTFQHGPGHLARAGFDKRQSFKKDLHGWTRGQSKTVKL